MPNIALISFSDIGKSQRLLNHARVLCKLEDIHVYIIGYDISRIPMDITNASNITVIFLSQFRFDSIPVFNILLFPLLILLSTLQLIGTFLSLPKLDFILLSLNHLLFDSLPLIITSKIKKEKIILDLDSFILSNDQKENNILKKTENFVFSFFDLIILSTKSKKMILSFRGFDSYVVPTIPPRYGQILNRVFNETDPIVGIITADFEEHNFSLIKTLIQQTEETRKTVHFHLFCTNRSYQILSDFFKDLTTKYVSVSYYNVSSISYFNDLQRCFIGIAPQKGTALDIPHSVIEMIGAGVPVITEKFGCISEIIKDRENGFLYENEKEIIKILMQSFDNDSVLKMRSKLLSIHEATIKQNKELFLKILNSGLPL